MNTKHTPGPWACTLNGQVSRETNDGLLPVADTAICTNTYNPSGEVVAANAKLISAAPDLLAACEELYEKCKDKELPAYVWEHIINEICPAIKKARGE